MNKSELIAEAERLGIDSSGTKAEIEARIAAASEATGATGDELAVRTAEAAGQRAVCSVPAGELPDDLAEALRLRVQHNLATTGGRPLQSCGAADPDVQRLEAPYRRKPRAADQSAADLEELPSGSLDQPIQEQE